MHVSHLFKKLLFTRTSSSTVMDLIVVWMFPFSSFSVFKYVPLMNICLPLLHNNWKSETTSPTQLTDHWISTGLTARACLVSRRVGGSGREANLRDRMNQTHCSKKKSFHYGRQCPLMLTRPKTPHILYQPPLHVISYSHSFIHSFIHFMSSFTRFLVRINHWFGTPPVYRPRVRKSGTLCHCSVT